MSVQAGMYVLDDVGKERDGQRQRTKDMSPGKTLLLLALSVVTAKHLVYVSTAKNYLI
jgi:hypothetical protein